MDDPTLGAYHAPAAPEHWAPHLAYHFPPAMPAASPAAPAAGPGIAAELRGSGLRMFVAFVSLATGQIIIGEADTSRVVRRAAVGAAMTEVTGALLRWAQRSAPLDAPLDLILLASYGPRELDAIARTVETALLQNRPGG